MNRLNARIWIGAALVLIGLLMLLDRLGTTIRALSFLQGIGSVIGGLIFIAAGGFFLYRFISHVRSEWWAAIPAFALLGIGAESLFSNILPDWGGFFFLAMLGLGFFAVFFTDRQRWWAIIPGGIFVTLALTTLLGNAFGMGETGGLVLMGFGLTFVLVALLASLQWAWIPGLILLVIGVFVGTPLEGWANYIWPAALILGGLLLILQFARKH